MTHRGKTLLRSATAVLTAMAVFGCSEQGPGPASPAVAGEAEAMADRVTRELAVTGGVIRGTMGQEAVLRQYHGIPYALRPWAICDGRLPRQWFLGTAYATPAHRDRSASSAHASASPSMTRPRTRCFPRRAKTALR